MIAGWDRTGFPAIPGHEWAGTVDAVGAGVEGDMLVGLKCVADNVWSTGGEVGFEHSGGYAQYFVTEAENLRILPDEYDLSHAALIEPLAVCVHGLARLREGGVMLSRQTLRRSVLILGDGPIGLLSVALFAAKGHTNIVLMGGRDNRLALAGQLGAGATVNYHTLGGQLIEGIQALGQRDYGVVIEASGSGAALEAAVALAGRQARVLVIGDYGQSRANFHISMLQHREMELLGSNASAGAWDDAVAMATCGKVPLERLITHRLPASDFAKGIALMSSRSPDAIKVVLEW